jgi:hydrogenase 3 maturation protease
LSGPDAGLCGGLKEEIGSRIRGSVAIAAIGNILRADDGLGSKLIELLLARGVKARLFDCGTAPENYIFPILAASCETVVLVDAADMGIAPGASRVLDPDKIMNVSFSTHSPSPRLFIDLLKTGRDDINIFILSVQPKSTMLGAPMSKEVLAGLETLSGILSELLA